MKALSNSSSPHLCVLPAPPGRAFHLHRRRESGVRPRRRSKLLYPGPVLRRIHHHPRRGLCAAAEEVQPVEDVLRTGGFSITSQGNHYLYDNPSLQFVHATASGDGIHHRRFALQRHPDHPVERPPSLSLTSHDCTAEIGRSSAVQLAPSARLSRPSTTPNRLPSSAQSRPSPASSTQNPLLLAPVLCPQSQNTAMEKLPRSRAAVAW